MPFVETRQFGAVEYDQAAVLRFPAGLPAFEQERRFVLLENPVIEPLLLLQSLDTPALSLPALPVLELDPTYELAVAAEDLEDLGLAGERQPVIGREVAAYVIVSAGATVNLLAPVLVNLATGEGRQVIQAGSGYPVALPLAPEVTSCS